MLTGRPRSLSHNKNFGNASENSDAALALIWDSVVRLEVDDCLLHVHTREKKEFVPTMARKPPEVDLVSSLSPQKSASV